jgi:predicted transposase YbfD/YdcC
VTKLYKVTNMPPCQENSRSFFQILQNADGLDLRDSRGKRHDLAVVLVGVTLAILSNRDGNLSSIQRHLKNHYEKLVTVLGVAPKRAVSRSQLPLILEQVAFQVFDKLLFESFGIKLSEGERKWFALDGKELRGSIEKGFKRGEAVVQAVTHENCQPVAQDYYSGEKESEVPIVRKILEEGEFASQKISLDALHCKPLTLAIISEKQGKYLVGLKENQKELKKRINWAMKKQAILCQMARVEKSHGRIEVREYEFYDVLELEKAERWKTCQIKTAIKVTREREELKSGKNSREESYYLSNEVGNYEELAQAIRQHWQVETNNHIRDVSLREDKMRSKKRVYKKQWRESELWQRVFWRKPGVKTKKPN